MLIIWGVGIETDLKFSLSYKPAKPQSFSISFYEQAEVLLQLSSQWRSTHTTTCAALQGAVKSRAGKPLSSSSGFPQKWCGWKWGVGRAGGCGLKAEWTDPEKAYWNPWLWGSRWRRAGSRAETLPASIARIKINSQQMRRISRRLHSLPSLITLTCYHVLFSITRIMCDVRFCNLFFHCVSHHKNCPVSSELIHKHHFWELCSIGWLYRNLLMPFLLDVFPSFSIL